MTAVNPHAQWSDDQVLDPAAEVDLVVFNDDLTKAGPVSQKPAPEPEPEPEGGAVAKTKAKK